MKHLGLLLFLLFSFSGCLLAQESSSSQPSTSAAYSPLQKGNWLVGAGLGSLNHTFNSSGLAISIYPRVGYFVSNNVAVGSQIQLNAQLGKGPNYSSYGLSPFIRYYFPGDETLRNRWFAEAQAGVLRNSFKDENNDRVITSVFGLSGGYAFFVSNSVALEGTLNLTRNASSYGSINDYTNLSLGLAFQIYLPGKANR
jgi:hypothetical protein